MELNRNFNINTQLAKETIQPNKMRVCVCIMLS